MRRLARTGSPGSCPLMIVCVSTGDNMGYLVAVAHAVCDCMSDDVTGWERATVVRTDGYEWPDARR